MDIDLYFGDCLDKLRTIPDKSIDLVVTDPPYELHTGGAGFMRDRPFWSELQELNIDKGFNEKVLSELVRVMRDINMYIWVSKKQLLPTFDYFAKSLGCSWTLLTWHKANPAPTINNKYLSDTEYCIFFKRGGGTTIRRLFHKEHLLYDNDKQVGQRQVYAPDNKTTAHYQEPHNQFFSKGRNGARSIYGKWDYRCRMQVA